MNQLNSIILEGNVVKENEVLEPTPGFKVYQFPLAVNRYYKNANGQPTEEVSYFDVSTYGALADVCKNECKKGRGMRVVGRIKQDRWEKDGKKESRIYVVAEHVEFKAMPTFKKEETNFDAMKEANTAAVSA